MSFFESVNLLPDDPVLGLTVAFLKDPRSTKVNLGVGSYKDAENRPLVLSTVKKAEKIIADQNHNKEYLPIDGDKDYISALLKLIFSDDSKVLTTGGTFGIQTVGGTGALRIGGDLLGELGSKTIFIPSPSWPNHKMLFSKTALKVDYYPYYDSDANRFNFEATCQAIRKMPSGSIILLQACCHNPTGADPTREQWEILGKAIKEQGVFPFFDLAYQGFADGLDEDAAAVRIFAEQGHEMLVAYSCSKNFGLYGERVGMLGIVTANSDIATRVASHLRIIVRTSYSSPSTHGSRIVKTILTTPDLRREWVREVATMRDRIHDMRQSLVAGLQANGGKRDFGFLKDQRGMFSFCGLDSDQVTMLKQEKGIYMLSNGRISVAGLNPQNLNYVVDAILNVI